MSKYGKKRAKSLESESEPESGKGRNTIRFQRCRLAQQRIESGEYERQEVWDHVIDKLKDDVEAEAGTDD